MGKISMRRIGIASLSILKYIIGVFMIYAGFQTITMPLLPAGSDFGWLYSTRPTLVTFGMIVMISGLLILYGKIASNRKVVGWGLLSTYACFTFATVIHFLGVGPLEEQTIANGIVMLITGALYLRWKFRFFYEDPRHRDEGSVHFRA